MEEYCQWETFNATCPRHNEVVLVTAARYGRMRVGRCLPVDYYVGCFADVLDHVELRCNGRPSCIVSIPDAELFRVQPCRKDLVAYFEASYRCVAGLIYQLTENQEPDLQNTLVTISRLSYSRLTGSQRPQSCGRLRMSIILDMPEYFFQNYSFPWGSVLPSKTLFPGPT